MSAAGNRGGYASGDTIGALSSRAGGAVRAVVRSSGPQAWAIAESVFVPLDGPLLEDQRQGLRRGWLKLAKGVKCPCLLYTFVGPHSYTGEDLVEYHFPGGPAVVRMAMAALTQAGARQAQAGEFTLRAFLAGRVDLSQAEGVAAVISSQTDAQLRAANSLAEGALSKAVGKIQAVLAGLMADVEANIDFVDQDIDFIGAEQALAEIGQVKKQLDKLLTEAVRLGDLDAEPRVVLAGWANVGKSTLLNSLSGRDRAIVSGVVGTTRDVLMAPMKIGQQDDENVLLMDAAGLGDASLDEVGRAARDAAMQAVGRADLVLYVLDAAEEIGQEQWQTLGELKPTRTVIVLNKMDLLAEEQGVALLEKIQQERKESVVAVSAKSGQGLDKLRKQIKEHLQDMELSVSQARLVLTARAEEGLKQARQALRQASDLLSGSETIENPELLAVELYEANAALGEITGEVTSEDILEDIFSRFCVGK